MQRLTQQAIRDRLAHTQEDDVSDPQPYVDESTDLAEVARRLRQPAPADVDPAEVPQLGWASAHDDRSRAFDVADRLRHRVPLQTFSWPAPAPLDQGVEGSCVGFAVATAANVRSMAAGTSDWMDDDEARQLYEDAQGLDEVTGSDYVGTSVLAGMKAGQAAGLWEGYAWAFGTRDIAQAVLQLGPVIVGLPWTTGMYATADNGEVTVTGDVVGGHCLTLIGLDLDRAGGPWFRWLNSWGADYGDAGVGWVHHRLLSQLLAGVGEAAIPVPALR